MKAKIKYSCSRKKNYAIVKTKADWTDEHHIDELMDGKIALPRHGRTSKRSPARMIMIHEPRIYISNYPN